MKVALCHSPVGEVMKDRARKFPGIINSSIIDYFHDWPRDALIDVANRFIKDLEFDNDKTRDKVAINMADIHVSIDVANAKYLKMERRYNYTTPTSFIELINFYRNVLTSKQNEIE